MEEFDLVCTHFFLDCLSQQEVAQLASRIQRRYPQARWVVSEFAIPAGVSRFPAWLLVRTLYFAFRLLTGLQPQRLPDYAACLRGAGFCRQRQKAYAFGLLRAELWQQLNSPVRREERI